MNKSIRAGLMVACVALVMASGAAHAAEVPIVSGEQWTGSTAEAKKIYLIGVANTLQLEAAYQHANPPTDAQSIVARFSKGLNGQTLDSVSARIDGWYAANPGKLDRPVLETVWFEIVVPATPKSK